MIAAVAKDNTISVVLPLEDSSGGVGGTVGSQAARRRSAHR